MIGILITAATIFSIGGVVLVLALRERWRRKRNEAEFARYSPHPSGARVLFETGVVSPWAYFDGILFAARKYWDANFGRPFPPLLVRVVPEHVAIEGGFFSGWTDVLELNGGIRCVRCTVRQTSGNLRTAVHSALRHEIAEHAFSFMLGESGNPHLPGYETEAARWHKVYNELTALIHLIHPGDSGTP